MSRLHRQKLRLRARQREDGTIDADSDVIDAKHFQKVGTARRPLRKSSTSSKPAETKTGEDAQKPPPQDPAQQLPS